MRILASRMNLAVHQFVSDTQTGFVLDAFLAENVMLLKLIQAYIEDEDSDAYFIFLDMEKAFDRCSWEFLIEAMRAIGFNDSFIDYIKLVYSHEHAPQRQLYVNGSLGPKFSLGSGVAQGCPISPLLFLLIAEPLSRLIQQNEGIQGVQISGINHKIAQFADDSGLIHRLGDEVASSESIDTWENATSMTENKGKRDGILLGKLNRERHRAPTGVIQGDAWCEDGQTIRYLGAPIGNNMDELTWWNAKYRTVKTRISLWPSMRRLSISGRNLLLQSIFYGSFRFYLYFMVMPKSIMNMIESDAKQILWATTPKLQANEDGSGRCRRYIREAPSYKPTSQGGAGIMHWPSHCSAFYAQWVVRYLDPRRAPWESIVHEWIADEHTGDAIILGRSRHRDRVPHIPETAHYIRHCFKTFNEIKIKQNTTLLDHTAQAEPLWENNRFDTGDLNRQEKHVWKETLDTTHIKDLLNEDSVRFTRDEWDAFFEQLAPPRIANSRHSFHMWRQERREELRVIRASVPRQVLTACVPPPPGTEDGTVALIARAAPHTVRYAHETHSANPPSYEELWLDTSNRPHRTGNLVPPNDDIIAPVVVWDDTPTDPPPTYGSKHKEPLSAPLPHAIIGPYTTAFPRNEGWHPEDSPAWGADH